MEILCDRYDMKEQNVGLVGLHQEYSLQIFEPI